MDREDQCEHPHVMGNRITRMNDPFTQPGSLKSELLNTILATALFRCWHLILFFTGWAAMVVLISKHVHTLSVASTLITVFGTVLGFVISYRTTASFERYNEGRRYWSAVVHGSRMLSRAIWFHVPDSAPPNTPAEKSQEMRARVLIEKKSALNLIEAFAVSLKHYLRGEEGIYYEDLYHLVKYLPAYALPAGRPSIAREDDGTRENNIERIQSRPSTRFSVPASPPRSRKNPTTQHAGDHELPTLHMTTATPSDTQKSGTTSMSIDVEKAEGAFRGPGRGGPDLLTPLPRTSASHKGGVWTGSLQPAWNPPPYALFDVFPFSLFVKHLQKRGKDVKGKKSAKLRARDGLINHNIPLELTLYLSSYVSTIQERKVADVPTLNMLISSVTQLVDSLTGLERILTTPIPFSYSIHLWTATTLFLALLPFQVYSTMKWLTIPATSLAAFIFYGFLVAGEEIENPFGYDKNDLNLDHFTHNIIRVELNALTSRPKPEVSHWAFESENSDVFAGHGLGERGVMPKEWISRGERAMRSVLATADH